MYQRYIRLFEVYVENRIRLAEMFQTFRYDNNAILDTDHPNQIWDLQWQMEYLSQGFLLLSLGHLQNRVCSIHHFSQSISTSARVDTHPSGRNTGSNLHSTPNTSFTQNCYSLVVQRWFRSLVHDIREHVHESTLQRERK